MAVKEILKFGNETLRKTCHPVQKFNLRLWLHPAGKQSMMMIKPPSEQPGGGFLIV